MVLWQVEADRGYKQFSLQTKTALQETDNAWAFGVTANRDVVTIKKNGTTTHTTEVHVLKG